MILYSISLSTSMGGGGELIWSGIVLGGETLSWEMWKTGYTNYMWSGNWIW